MGQCLMVGKCIVETIFEIYTVDDDSKIAIELYIDILYWCHKNGYKNAWVFL